MIPCLPSYDAGARGGKYLDNSTLVDEGGLSLEQNRAPFKMHNLRKSTRDIWNFFTAAERVT